jgi:hypothetical protein
MVSMVALLEQVQAEEASRDELHLIEDKLVLNLRNAIESYMKTLSELTAQTVELAESIRSSWTSTSDDSLKKLFELRDQINSTKPFNQPQKINNIVADLSADRLAEYISITKAYSDARESLLNTINFVEFGDEDPSLVWGQDWKEMIEQARSEVRVGERSFFASDDEFLASL